MRSDRMILFLSLFCMFTVLTENVVAQEFPRPNPGHGAVDPPQDWQQWIFRNNTFRAAGVEAGISTYNYYIGFPVFWVQNQVKIVPQMSLFWNQPESWRHSHAYGGRALFFLNNQRMLNRGDMNPYAGGFTAIAGREHNTGIVVGVEPFFFGYLKIGFELHAGLRSHYGEDKAFGGGGIVVGFNW